MGRLKAKTTVEKAGFKDTEYKTPEHDEIMMWLDQNMSQIVQDIVRVEELSDAELEKEKQKAFKLLEDQQNEIEDKIKTINRLKIFYVAEKDLNRLRKEDKKLADCKQQLDALKKWSGLPSPPAVPSPEVSSKHWEFSIINRNSIIGFIDMVVKVKTYHLYVSRSSSNMVPPLWDFKQETKILFFEVKTKIDSIGELIRQIRFYQAYEQGQYVVVCPDDSAANLLREQGIGFVKYAPKRTKTTTKESCHKRQ